MDFLSNNEQTSSSRTTFDYEREKENDETPKKRKKIYPTDELLAIASQKLLRTPDKFERIGEAWSAKLRELDRTQAIFAEKFINEILFEAEIGTLHRNAMHLNVLNSSSTPQKITQYSEDFPENSGYTDESRTSPRSTTYSCTYIDDSSTVGLPKSPQDVSPLSPIYIQGSASRSTLSPQNLPMISPQEVSLHSPI